MLFIFLKALSVNIEYRTAKELIADCNMKVTYENVLRVFGGKIKNRSNPFSDP
jgi:hypothetical protein